MPTFDTKTTKLRDVIEPTAVYNIYFNCQSSVNTELFSVNKSSNLFARTHALT